MLLPTLSFPLIRVGDRQKYQLQGTWEILFPPIIDQTSAGAFCLVLDIVFQEQCGTPGEHPEQNMFFLVKNISYEEKYIIQIKEKLGSSREGMITIFKYIEEGNNLFKHSEKEQ